MCMESLLASGKPIEGYELVYAVTMGDAFATYIETNVFNFATSVYNGSYDSYAGARVVFRYNWVIGTNSGGHGFDSGPTYRSTFRQEVYRIPSRIHGLTRSRSSFKHAAGFFIFGRTP